MVVADAVAGRRPHLHEASGQRELSTSEELEARAPVPGTAVIGLGHGASADVEEGRDADRTVAELDRHADLAPVGPAEQARSIDRVAKRVLRERRRGVEAELPVLRQVEDRPDAGGDAEVRIARHVLLEVERSTDESEDADPVGEHGIGVEPDAQLAHGAVATNTAGSVQAEAQVHAVLRELVDDALHAAKLFELPLDAPDVLLGNVDPTAIPRRLLLELLDRAVLHDLAVVELLDRGVERRLIDLEADQVLDVGVVVQADLGLARASDLLRHEDLVVLAHAVPILPPRARRPLAALVLPGRLGRARGRGRSRCRRCRRFRRRRAGPAVLLQPIYLGLERFALGLAGLEQRVALLGLLESLLHLAEGDLVETDALHGRAVLAEGKRRNEETSHECRDADRFHSVFSLKRDLAGRNLRYAHKGYQLRSHLAPMPFAREFMSQKAMNHLP